MMLTEDVKVDTSTGRLVADSTWTYKVPSAETIPREFHVHLLKDHPHARGIMSSKATGEPPLLLSVSSLCAVQVMTCVLRISLYVTCNMEYCQTYILLVFNCKWM
jgi:xanthine dehydrogenase molybdopterin-binding subunit B